MKIRFLLVSVVLLTLLTSFALAADVAQVGSTTYTDLQDAINDIQSTGGTIKLLDNVTLTAQNQTYKRVGNRAGFCGLLIPDDSKAITLELNGKTITYTSAASNQDDSLIFNLGDLTIQDSGANGRILFNSASNPSNYRYIAATIYNAGKLTVKSGTVENHATIDTDCSAAIDNDSAESYAYANDTVCLIEGGNILSNKYYAIRMYTHYLTGYKNSLTINDGIVTGIYLQHGDSWYYPNASSGRLANADLTINGGRIKTLKAADDYTCVALRVNLANPDNPNFSFKITGGTLDDVSIRIKRGHHYANGVSGALAPKESDGQRNQEWMDKTGGFISGGTFTTAGDPDDPTTNLASFLTQENKVYPHKDENGNTVYSAFTQQEIEDYEASLPTPTPVPTATPSPTPAPVVPPKTGDDTNLTLLAALAAMSCMAFVLLRRRVRTN